MNTPSNFFIPRYYKIVFVTAIVALCFRLEIVSASPAYSQTSRWLPTRRTFRITSSKHLAISVKLISHFIHYSPLIKLHVWQTWSTNCQDPHFVHRITGSWVSVASANFFAPIAQHLRHWNTLNPSAVEYPSSQMNSELAEQKLHLNFISYQPILTL